MKKNDRPLFVGYNRLKIKKDIEMECTRSCFWWGLFLSGIVTFGAGTGIALLWLFFEWLFRVSETSSSDYDDDDYDDEDKEDKPFDIDDDLSGDDEIYIYENFINK